MLKKTKYNDNSTEEEFSESEFLEIDLSRLSPVKLVFRFLFLNLNYLESL